jgi:hypothetical protein
MKLSKALKLKNKKVTDYNNTVTKMISVNSYDITSKRYYDTRKLLEEVIVKRDDLIKFKTAIHTTSEPIREKIFRLGELKNLLMNFNRLSTNEGVIKSRGYGTEEVTTYKCTINELEKVALIESIQTEIEDIQDDIDVFNATTELKGY